MREIKFRAWDKVRMVMFYPDELWVKKDNNWNCINRVSGFAICETDNLNGDLMQYTGLKDKNGKEGYHKDIVRSGKKLYSIEWQNEEARFWLAPYGNNTGTWQFMDMLKSFEIIGNLYETPSLIN